MTPSPMLLKLPDELKAGNLSVRYSKRFARLEEFFIDECRWQGMRKDFFRRSGLPSDAKAGTPISRAPSRQSL
jgi:hypothetical protein